MSQSRESQSPGKVQQVQDLRRSGASGIHGRKKTDRQNTRRQAIEESRDES